MRKVAIVTGASSGIGRAMALHLAGEGISMLLVGRDKKRLQDIQMEIQNRYGTASVVSADIGESASAQRIVDTCVDEFGRIDILINNAGIGHYHHFSTMPPDAYMTVTKTNWDGVLHLSSRVLPFMIAQKEGTIVNVSSMGAMTGVPYRSVYCATKAAVRNWSRSLFMELRPHGIHVLCVIPGSTATSFFNNIIGNPPMAHSMPGGTMDSDKTAQLIWKGMTLKKREIILSPMGKMVDLANRLSTTLIDALVNFQHRRTT